MLIIIIMSRESLQLRMFLNDYETGEKVQLPIWSITCNLTSFLFCDTVVLYGVVSTITVCDLGYKLEATMIISTVSPSIGEYVYCILAAGNLSEVDHQMEHSI